MINLLHGLMEDKIAKSYVTHLLNQLKADLYTYNASRRLEDDLDMPGM
jgi:hypothetical protein